MRRTGRFTGLHFCPPTGSAAPGKYSISLLWLALFTDQFTFEDSLPRHVRARPINYIRGPLRLWQGRRRRRDGDRSRSTCWLNGGDLVVSVRAPPSLLHPSHRLAIVSLSLSLAPYPPSPLPPSFLAPLPPPSPSLPSSAVPGGGNTHPDHLSPPLLNPPLSL
jgi:hypothetical protein